MLTGGHFYYETIKRMVSLFGTLFNNLYVLRKDSEGNVLSQIRVPLAYGPRQKFLARLQEQPDITAENVAIKLPRMSFEIVGMTYAPEMKTNRNIPAAIGNSTSTGTTQVFAGAPYRIQFQLSVMSKNQDDAHQIVEQIIPYFQPDYTVTVKQIPGFEDQIDVPFVLTGINMSEDYEGDFVNRRAIIYTLDFESRVRFYGPSVDKRIIKNAIVDVNHLVGNQPLLETISAAVVPANAGPADPHTITTTITPFVWV